MPAPTFSKILGESFTLGGISPSLALDITLIQDVTGRIAIERLYCKWWFEGHEQITWYALIWQKSAINIQNKTMSYHLPVIQFLNSSSNYHNKGFLILYWDHSKCLVRKKIWILIPMWRVKIAIEYISQHTHLYKHVHYRPKVWNILKPNGNTRTWHFDLPEMAWHQPQPSIVTLMHFSCIVSGVKNTTCSVRN